MDNVKKIIQIVNEVRTMTVDNNQMNKKWIDLRKALFVLSVIGTGLMLYPPLRNVLYGPGHRSDYYDHIQVIPFMSAALFFWGRDTIFADIRYLPRFGIPLIVCGVGFYAVGFAGLLPLNPNILISWITFSALLAFVGAFVFLFGAGSFRKARFPLLFLAFMIPIPHVILEHFIYSLQISSTEVTDLLFGLIGVPYYRDGFLFYLPGVAIEVAKECSGIRSSLALIVTGVLAGHLFLDRGWKQVLLILSIFPITVLKNGIRIVTLTLLATYVDIRFLTQSWLHHSGGFVFYIPALALLGLEIWALRKWSRRPSVKP
jgi:exosortase